MKPEQIAVFLQTGGKEYFGSACENQDGFLCFRVDEVEVLLDDLETCPVIENAESYSQEELSVFDYCEHFPYADKTKPLLVLQNFLIEMRFPVKVERKEEILQEELLQQMQHSKDGFCNTYQLLGQVVPLKESLPALELLAKALAPAQLQICAFCQYGSWHPYGGSDFLNHVCFYNSREQYLSLPEYSKTTTGPLMIPGGFSLVYPIDCCTRFENQKPI